MDANFFARMGLLALVTLAVPACSEDTEDTASAASAASKKKPAEKEAPATGVQIVVSAKAAEAADTFIWTFMEKFMEYAKNETRQGNRGASTWDEIDAGIYKLAGNDGDIMCEFPKKETCTFTFKKPADKELGVPVSGGSSSSLADSLAGYFRPRAVQVAGVGGVAGFEGADAFAIGEPDDGYYIVCQSDTPDRGIPTSKCGFFLTGTTK